MNSADNYLKISFSFVIGDIDPGGSQYSPVRLNPINFVSLISNLCLLTSQSITTMNPWPQVDTYNKLFRVSRRRSWNEKTDEIIEKYMEHNVPCFQKLFASTNNEDVNFFSIISIIKYKILYLEPFISDTSVNSLFSCVLSS